MGKSIRKTVPIKKVERRPVSVPRAPRPPVSSRNPFRVLPILGNFIQTSDFDDRREYGQHGGIDLAPTTDNPYIPAVAINSGRVISVQPGWNDGYGNVVTMALDGGGYARYAHLDSFAVQQGQRVEAGDILGNVGNTGDSSGRHLHFELRGGLLQGQTIDPVRWVRELLGESDPYTRNDSVRTYMPNSKTTTEQRFNVPDKPQTRYSRPPEVRQEVPRVPQPGDYPPNMPGNPYRPIIGRVPSEVVGRDISQERFEAIAAYNQSDPFGVNRTYMEARADIVEGYETIKEDISTVVEENIGYVVVMILALMVAAVTVYGLVK